MSDKTNTDFTDYRTSYQGFSVIMCFISHTDCLPALYQIQRPPHYKLLDKMIHKFTTWIFKKCFKIRAVPSPLQLIISHPSFSQPVSAIYSHHQVSSISLKSLHCMVCQKFISHVNAILLNYIKSHRTGKSII
jgi:hypothetical protein